MRLFVREYGSGFPVVILHGLYGSGENFRSFAEKYSCEYRVILPDLRNHGLSQHAYGMSYQILAKDVAATLDDLDVSCCHLIGHSLGGKAAIEFALEFPSRVNKLIAVDIAPKPYQPKDLKILRALTSLNPASFPTRQSIEESLAPSIPDRMVRLFLMKNIMRDSTGSFILRIGMNEIEEGYPDIWGGIEPGRRFHGDVLFLRGGDSDYVEESDENLIRSFFPKADIMTIPRAGHWVQVDQPEKFASVVIGFLNTP